MMEGDNVSALPARVRKVGAGCTVSGAGGASWIHGAAALGHMATWHSVSATRGWLRRDLGVLTGLPEWSEASPAPLA